MYHQGKQHLRESTVLFVTVLLSKGKLYGSVLHVD